MSKPKLFNTDNLVLRTFMKGWFLTAIIIKLSIKNMLFFMLPSKSNLRNIVLILFCNEQIATNNSNLLTLPTDVDMG